MNVAASDIDSSYFQRPMASGAKKQRSASMVVLQANSDARNGWRPRHKKAEDCGLAQCRRHRSMRRRDGM
jgi:hypothetical protein